MSNKSQEKFTAVEVVYLIIAFAVVAASLGFVITSLNDSPSDIIADYASFGGGYDISVINSATAQDFMQVYGIGEVKASAIISYRDALGGFDDVYQLLDLSTITSQNFEDIVSYFYFGGGNQVSSETDETEQADDVSNIINSPSEGEDDFATDDTVVAEKVCTKVNINAASADEISKCLLIEIHRAEQIVAMRELLGGYNYIQEVLLCDLITEDIYARIKPYLLLE